MTGISGGLTRKRPKGPRRLGVVAFILSVAAVIVAGVVQFIAGSTLGSIAQYDVVKAAIEAGGQIDPSTLPAAGKQIVANVNAISVTGSVVYLVIGVWALIQGIVAIVRRRGRAWGVAAVCIVVVGFFLVQIAYNAGLTLGAAPYLR
jgi:hypothetical protein